MSTRFRIAVSVFALLFAFLGLRWMFGPEAAAGELGIQLGDAVARNTARGDLGGMFIAAAILCGLGVAQAEARWLQAVALVVGCIAFGRSVGLVVDGYATGSLMPLLLEIAMVIVLLLAARSQSNASPIES
jgi:hypothetical protein